MLKRILFVDDEPNVLQAFERQFRKQFEFQTALGPELGLQTIAQRGPFAVVVSDLCMPGMNGIEFLTQVRQLAPDTVRVMLTGQADLGATIAAVNQGKIFQFLTKPCPADMLARALEAALSQHRMMTAERELLDQTLRGSIGVLSEILSLVNPPAFGKGHRIRRYVQRMAAALKLAEPWQYDLAAMLSQIGCVTVPSTVLDKSKVGENLTAAEQQVLSAQCQIGRNLISKIPRLEHVANMVAQQNKPWGGRSTRIDPVATGASMLRTALDFDDYLMRGDTGDAALARMRACREYDPDLLTVLAEFRGKEATVRVSGLPVTQLETGMIVAADVMARNGMLLLAKGQELTDSAIARLRSFAVTAGVIEPVQVMLDQRRVEPLSRIPATAAI